MPGIACAQPLLAGVTPSINSIQVNWLPVTSAINGYTIQWRAGSGSFVATTVASSVTTFNITGLEPSTTYEIQLKAHCGFSSSVETNTSATTLANPACSLPTINNISTTANTITVNWLPVASASLGYVLSYRMVGNLDWIQITGIPANQNSFTITGLMLMTDYEVQIRSICSANNRSGWSSRTIKTLPAICEPPTITSIIPSLNSVVVNWTSNPAATQGYILAYREGTSGDFTTNNLPAGATATSISNLKAGTQYQIQLTSRCASGNSASFVGTITTLNPACETPTFTAVTPTNSTINVAWNASSSAQSYTLSWRRVGGVFSSETVTAPTNNFIINNLDPCLVYEINILSRCGIERQSGISSTSITTLAGPNTPSSILINNGINSIIGCGNANLSLDGGTQPGFTYQWRRNGIEIPGATSGSYNATQSGEYDLILRDGNCQVISSMINVTIRIQPMVTAFVQQQASSPTSNDGVILASCMDVPGRSCAMNPSGYQFRAMRTGFDTGFQPSGLITGLAPGSYTIMIIDNENGCIGSYTDVINTTITGLVCPAPSNLVLSTTGTTVIANWSPVSVPNNGYILSWSSDGNNFTETTVLGTSFNIINLIPSINYTVRVRTNCTGGSNSAFTSSTITTGPAPCIAPTIISLTSTSTSVSIFWNVIPAAVNGYRVRLRNLSNGSINEALIPNPNVTNVSLGDLNPGQTYEATVQSLCSLTESTASTSRVFATEMTASTCGTPSIIAATATATSATIYWSSILGANQYTLQWRPVGSSQWSELVILTGTNSTINSRVLFFLVPNTLYEVRVNAVCRGVASAWSMPQQFFTNFNSKAENLNLEHEHSKFELYPNPNNGQFSVRFFSNSEKDIQVRVRDLNGKLIFNNIAQAKIGINVLPIHIQDIPTGMYLLEIQQEEGSMQHTKLMIR